MEFLQGIFSRIRGWFSGIWEKTEKRDRTRFLVISGVAVVLLIAAMVMLNNTRYTTLAGVDNPVSRRAAAGILAENGIRSKTSGNDLLVNKKDESAAMAALMQSDNISINDLDFSIYAEATGLTSTDADRRMYSKFQKEADLKWAFESMPIIDRAKVVIELPENKGFGRVEKPASVAVVLHLNSEISKAQVDTLEVFVQHATNIMPENITLSDQNIRHLNKRVDDDGVASMQNHYEFKRQYEQDLERSVSHPLDLMFGAPNFSVNVYVDFDFDEKSSEIITYTPVNDEDGIRRSFTTLTEFAKGAGYYGGQPGTDEDGLGDEYPEVDDSLFSEYRKAQETANYEVNQIIERINSAPYRLRGITASVLINTNGLEDVGENTEAVQAIIGGSLGLPASQFGNVVVRYQPMLGVERADAQQDEWNAQQRREEMFSLIQTLVLYGVIGICVILLILRTFSFLKPKPVELPPGLDMLAGDVDEYSELLEAAEASTELEITKTPTRERIEEFIENNAEAVASMLRTWLQEEDDSRW